MKRTAIVMSFLLLLASQVSYSDAVPYTLPDGTHGFFLLRSDMEKAVQAQEDVVTWQKTAEAEKILKDALEQEKKTLQCEVGWLIAGDIIGLSLGVLCGYLLHK